MTATARRRALALCLLLPLATVPLVAFALMEFGPERSFLSAIYLLVAAIAFLVSGVIVAIRRPAATVREVLVRAAVWSLALLGVVLAALFVLSFVLVPRTT